MPSLQLTKKKIAATVGLDIEAGSVAAVEVRAGGAGTVSASAIGAVPAGAFEEGEVADVDSLAAALKSFFAEHKLSKAVRLGVANQHVVVRSVRLPALEDPKELDAAVRFQAQEQIPMPLEQAVLEHQVIGAVPAEEGATPQLDVLVVAARREMISCFVEATRRAGLQPVGIDLSAFAMIRALAGPSAPAPESGERPGEAVLYCNVGDITNLAVARGRSCLFTRVSHAGIEPIVAGLAAARGLSPEHAFQWLAYVGLERPVEAVEGDPETVAEARRVLEAGLGALLDELRLSLDYYGAQEGSLPVSHVVLAGPGSAIPGLPQEMGSRIGLPLSVVRPEALASFGESDAARLTLSYGLALES